MHQLVRDGGIYLALAHVPDEIIIEDNLVAGNREGIGLAFLAGRHQVNLAHRDAGPFGQFEETIAQRADIERDQPSAGAAGAKMNGEQAADVSSNAPQHHEPVIAGG